MTYISVFSAHCWEGKAQPNFMNFAAWRWKSDIHLPM